MLPGFSSASAFDSLINAEKNIDKPSVKNLIKSKVSGNTIGGLISKLTNMLNSIAGYNSKKKNTTAAHSILTPLAWPMVLYELLRTVPSSFT